jgi:hypothetical protein
MLVRLTLTSGLGSAYRYRKIAHSKLKPHRFQGLPEASNGICDGISFTTESVRGHGNRGSLDSLGQGWETSMVKPSRAVPHR